jgi:sugar (pentulose or hexulose) kinase
MPVVLGIDLGTTTITALALDTGTGAVLMSRTVPNRAEVTSPGDKANGFSEWDAGAIAEAACDCLRAVAQQLGGRRGDLAGLGITGQQHGVVLVDGRLVPVTPLVNWQDRRGDQRFPGTRQTYAQRAAELTGADAPLRTGCRLATGYMGVTLFWLKETGTLPAGATACFLTDFFAARLTGRPPVTDPTCAASSGLFAVTTDAWDDGLIAALGLPRSLFPEVRPSGDPLGALTPAMAMATGLPAGLPVCVGVGDNQASFLGSVADRGDAVLVNVGTGAQVTAYGDEFADEPPLETRPFPRGGYLLVCAGLCGGGSYAVLERFYRQVGAQFFGARSDTPLFATMNQHAAAVPRGAGGLHCEPYFTGTRARPELRATWTGMSADNFTPAYLTRALLEGVARSLREGYDALVRQTGRPATFLVGAGNGLRENRVLAGIVAGEWQMPLHFPVHREEAAYGAGLLASVGVGVYPDLASACRLVRYAGPAG